MNLNLGHFNLLVERRFGVDLAEVGAMHFGERASTEPVCSDILFFAELLGASVVVIANVLIRQLDQFNFVVFKNRLVLVRRPLNPWKLIVLNVAIAAILKNIKRHSECFAIVWLNVNVCRRQERSDGVRVLADALSLQMKLVWQASNLVAGVVLVAAPEIGLAHGVDGIQIRDRNFVQKCSPFIAKRQFHIRVGILNSESEMNDEETTRNRSRIVSPICKFIARQDAGRGPDDTQRDLVLSLN